MLNNFLVKFDLSVRLPVQPVAIALFIAHLFDCQYAASTIMTYVAAISFLHKLYGLPDPGTNFLVQRAILGVKKTKPQIDLRLPITLPILKKLTDALNVCVQTSYHIIMFRSMYLLAFASFLRVGEITVSNKNFKNVLQLHNLQRSTNSKGLNIIFHNFKHSAGRQVKIDIARKNDGYCPVESLEKYLSIRGSKPGFLYTWPSGNPVTRKQFTEVLKYTLTFCNLDPNLYKAHSFRIGAACHATALGYSDTQIREMGRWRSDAFKSYIRL